MRRVIGGLGMKACSRSKDDLRGRGRPRPHVQRVLDYPFTFSENLLPDPVLLVHGGAWAMPDEMVDVHLNGVRNALEAGWRVLSRGGSSLDAVE
jgi:hypothetical protein